MGLWILFVGGRMQAGRYAGGALNRSCILNTNGELVRDRAAMNSSRRPDWSPGAIFTDLDGDGYPELVLAV